MACVIATLLLGLLPRAHAQLAQIPTAPAAPGSQAAHDGTTGWAALAQPAAGEHRSADGHWSGRVGFLGAVILAPAADHDADGLCDEFEDDNDGDGLDDSTEIAGTAFVPPTATDPNRADTDGDGAGDADERDSDTSPTDAASRLAVTRVAAEAGTLRIEWVGGTHATQYLARATRVDGADGWQVIFTNAPPTAPVVTVRDSGATNAATFYRLRAVNPASAPQRTPR